MVNLTFLNDASVFWNLKTRYQAKMIHTYSGLEKPWLQFKLFLLSGLFVVVVNPYKRYPLYTHRVCKIYLGKRRNEVTEYQQLQRKCIFFNQQLRIVAFCLQVPPHLWAIAEAAYRNMLANKKVES